MSKLTTKGNKRRDAQIQVLEMNARTIGATNYSPTALDLSRGAPKHDQSQTVTGRNYGTKGTPKTKQIPTGPSPVGKIKAKKKRARPPRER